eukprot:jgi/Mesvir1/9436/Mv25491-RA.1
MMSNSAVKILRLMPQFAAVANVQSYCWMDRKPNRPWGLCLWDEFLIRRRSHRWHALQGPTSVRGNISLHTLPGHHSVHRSSLFASHARSRSLTNP